MILRTYIVCQTAVNSPQSNLKGIEAKPFPSVDAQLMESFVTNPYYVCPGILNKV